LYQVCGVYQQRLWAIVKTLSQILLVLSVCIQLGGFFGISASAMIISKLKSIRHLVDNTETAEIAFLIVALVSLVHTASIAIY
jgi:hypothetical protein